MASFVGVVDIVCGMLLLPGLHTRQAAIPLIIKMLVAILSTKIPGVHKKAGLTAQICKPLAHYRHTNRHFLASGFNCKLLM
jgi:uncharacterized membrane protein YphA (DoxX/SURF4 family)